jgi:hypothetical protein
MPSYKVSRSLSPALKRIAIQDNIKIQAFDPANTRRRKPFGINPEQTKKILRCAMGEQREVDKLRNNTDATSLPRKKTLQNCVAFFF